MAQWANAYPLSYSIVGDKRIKQISDRASFGLKFLKNFVAYITKMIVYVLLYSIRVVFSGATYR